MTCRRLVQTFLYQRTIWEGEELQSAYNHYTHPIDVVTVVDLNTQSVVKIDGLDRVPPPKVPQLSVNYHRSLIQTNSFPHKGREAARRGGKPAPLPPLSS